MMVLVGTQALTETRELLEMSEMTENPVKMAVQEYLEVPVVRVRKVTLVTKAQGVTKASQETMPQIPFLIRVFPGTLERKDLMDLKERKAQMV